MICAIEDQGESYWSNNINLITGAIDTALGTGANNTSVIIGIQGEQTDYAAGLARAYRGGGYTDWFLPSKDELKEMYDSKSILEANAKFTAFRINTGYWSSSEFNSTSEFNEDRAWYGYFGITTNFVFYKLKARSYYVRPIRAF